jgi:hypothetical protein
MRVVFSCGFFLWSSFDYGGKTAGHPRLFARRIDGWGLGIDECGMRNAECGIFERVRGWPAPFQKIPHSLFRIPHSKYLRFKLIPPNMKKLLILLAFGLSTALSAQSSIGLDAASVLSDYQNAGYTPEAQTDDKGNYTVSVMVEGATLTHTFDANRVCNSMLVYPAHKEGLEYYKSMYTKVYKKTSETTWQTQDRTITLECKSKDQCWFVWK